MASCPVHAVHYETMKTLFLYCLLVTSCDGIFKSKNFNSHLYPDNMYIISSLQINLIIELH
jgi:hypothetical protein